jgi:hypothetical protein
MAQRRFGHGVMKLMSWTLLISILSLGSMGCAALLIPSALGVGLGVGLEADALMKAKEKKDAQEPVATADADKPGVPAGAK